VPAFDKPHDTLANDQPDRALTSWNRSDDSEQSDQGNSRHRPGFNSAGSSKDPFEPFYRRRKIPNNVHCHSRWGNTILVDLLPSAFP
jgi:hypothetical protein